MTAFDLDSFQRLACQEEFVQSVDVVGGFAIEDNDVAGFTAQRHGANAWGQLSEIQYSGKAENRGRTFELIPEEALDNVGVYVVGRPDPPSEVYRRRGLVSYVPTPADIKTFCALRERNPGVISGLVIPSAIGGSALFLFRESETRAFDPPGALELALPELSDKDAPGEVPLSGEHLTEVFGKVGLNWTLLTYADRMGWGTRFTGEVKPLFS